MSKKNIITIVVIVGVVAALIGWWVYAENQPSKYDEFAKCLGEKGAIFYGAFWCSHCQDQKTAFGKAKKHLPYTECSTPDTNGQLPVCKDAGVKVYPTWKFSDGSTHEGEMSLQELAAKTGCTLP